MRVLVVDDLRTFSFGFEPVYARSSAEAMPLLKEEWDELWLDHDLGGEDTTIPVVDWLAEAAFNGCPAKVGIIVIHSSNPSGSQTIERTLKRYGYTVRRVDAARFI